MNDIFVFDIARLAVKSIVSAAALHPKPGLVTPLENNALDGMDFPRVLDGVMGLFPCLVNCASIGFETEPIKPEEAMTLLRPVGRRGEQEVLQATRGGLALRGTIFLMGLLCAAGGRLAAQERNLTPMALALTASSFARGVCERELWGLKEDEEGGTPGERAYALYGMDGCRGEAERGFPLTLRAAGLLENLGDTHGHLSLRERAVHVLLHIMVENGDTSLAGRGGIDGLLQVQEAARQALASGGMLAPAGREAVEEMDRAFRGRGISPCGSAVVLSAALFLLALKDLPPLRSDRPALSDQYLSP